MNAAVRLHFAAKAVCIVIGILLLLAYLPVTAADPDPCAGLLSAEQLLLLPDAPTTLVSAENIAATISLPGHCRVRGYVAPQVNFELRLPVDWNGKFLMQGCGGLCGRIPGAACDDALARNYAVVATDLGHQAPSFQALWALDNLRAEIDFAYRGTHVVAVAAKALVNLFYSRPPSYSYFRGCSTGGRQGLVEAQRFPQDFDGIIAGAPVLNETATAALHLIWSGRANLDANRQPIMSAARVAEVQGAVVGHCDLLDGFQDGIIDDPRRCDWEAALRQCEEGDICVSAAELSVLRKFYDGPSNSKGELLLPGGLMPGSEYEWVPYFVGQDGPAVFHPDGPIKQLYQSLLFYRDPGPGHSAWEFNFDNDPQRLALMETFYTALNPDLRKFRDHGGKLIIYQGWDDVEVTPLNTIDYFETMQATMGGEEKTKEFARLFMLPGVAHCRRGPGADTVDWLTTLERWVEEGQMPDRLVAHHPLQQQSYMGLPRPRFPLPDDQYDWTRPVFPYPNVSHFGLSGDPADQRNWFRRPPASDNR